MKAYEKLQTVREALQKKFLEREEVIDGMLAGMIAEQHVFLLGPAGTAKSDLTRSLCGSMGGEFFQYLLGKFTTPEELYGPPSLKALEQDRYERMTDRTLITANVAFLDEIFKCSPSTLNTMLPCLNERLFFNGTKAVRMPLEFAVGASNELPESGELGALYDRFLIRFFVNRLATRDNARAMLMGVEAIEMNSLSPADRAELRKAAAALEIPENMMTAVLEIRDAVHQAGIYVSDRKWRQALGVIRAVAVLEGHKEVESDDLAILRHMLWDRPEQRTTINKIVAKHSSPIGEQVMELLDGCRSLMSSLDETDPAKKISPVEAHGKVKAAVTALKKLSEQHPSNKRAAAAVVEAQKLLTQLLTEKLGLK